MGELLTGLGIAGVAVYAFLQGQGIITRIAEDKTEVAVALRELKVALIGFDGKNGMRGEIKELRGDVTALGERLDLHHDQIAALATKRPTAKRRRGA